MSSHHVSRLNRSISQLILAGILSFLLAACNPAGGGFTPEEAVRKNFSASDRQIASVKGVDKGAVVLYSNVRPDFDPDNPSTPSYQFGFSYVDQQNGRWWVRSGRGGAYTPEQGAKIMFSITRIKVNNPDPANALADDPTAPLIIYGKVLDEQIVAVKLLTQDLQEIQDPVAGSMFGIVVRPEVIPCTLQLLDIQGNILEPIDLTDLEGGQVPSAILDSAKKSCPQVDSSSPDNH